METIKILIVEDDEIFREAMEHLLRNFGHEIRSCTCGKEALACLADEEFDILITDFRMPGMDGLELIEKAQALTSNMATVLVTGVPPENLGDRLKKSKVDGFLSKPIDWQEMTLLLESLSGEDSGREKFFVKTTC